MQPVFLWTDLLIYVLIIGIVITIFLSKQREVWREQWRRVGQRKLGMIAGVLLAAFTVVALCDSIHFKIRRPANSNNATTTLGIQSLLDVLIRPLGKQNEETYSAPFAMYSSIKRSAFINGTYQTTYPRLIYGGQHLTSSHQKAGDIIKKSSLAIGMGLVLSAILITGIVFILAKKAKLNFTQQLQSIIKGQTTIAWREIFISTTFIILVACYIKMMSPYYHLFGTDKIGGDVLYETIKSIRTGLIIGTLTTLVMLPFAVYFGTEAGYFGGWRDDIIQYIYTTLSSIPSVLLISAAVLSLEIYISNHPNLFATLETRADARLLALCIILGITSWTTLCRLLRAETLKLRELDYVKASIAMGVKNIKVIWRHIVPNVLHIILITVVLDFSALVLAEAVLSYVGVGVDPITPSWGNMINSARLDLAREPVVWWPLMAAFVFMFILVLAANLFADAVQDAFDPRLRNEV
jgi:peptide/nickel transport system permease protein